MTFYEYFMMILGSVSCLAGLGSFVIALLNFLKKRNDRENK